MSRAAVYAGAGVAMAIGGFSLGRYAAPTRVETRERVVERQVQAKEDRAEERKAETAAHVVGTKYVIRYLERPDGTKERIESTETKRSDVATKRDEKVRVQKEVQYRDREVVREKLVTRDSGAGWSIGGAAGLGLDLRPRYSAEVDRRIIGPVRVGLRVTSDKAALVTLRWEF